jgi:hypothetical protein
LSFEQRMAVLHADVVEVKVAIKEVSSAITKLALVEERQAHHAAAQERAFKLIDKIDARVCSIEKTDPAQARTSEWVDRMVWSAAAAAVMFVAAKSGLLQ